MIVYYGNLVTIDKSYYEAAKLDCATRFQMARYISIPYNMPFVIMCFILSLGRVFSADFGLFYYMTKDSSLLYQATDVIDTYIFRALKTNGDVGMSAAVGFFQSVVGFCTILIANGIVKKIERQNALF